MPSESPTFEGGCACGAVRFTARGAPRRAGLCHCRTCQRLHGAAFFAYAIFEAHRVDLRGETRRWQSSPGYTRLACATCGTRIGGLKGEEIELSLTLFEGPGTIEPQYECWTRRRLAWLPALPVPQYEEHRVVDAPS